MFRSAHYSVGNDTFYLSSDNRTAFAQYHETMQSIRAVNAEDVDAMLDIFADAPGFVDNDEQH
jgi:hypothetical protein